MALFIANEKRMERLDLEKSNESANFSSFDKQILANVGGNNLLGLQNLADYTRR